MTRPRPFRFGVQSRLLGPRSSWLEGIHRIEDAGYSSCLVLDHFVRGLEPVAALGAAAIATSTLRLGSMVFANDFRHPAVLAKAAATIDVLSDGRLELGIGAGWLREEYDQAGIPFDPPATRIERMVDGIHYVKRALAEERMTMDGDHYTANALALAPKTVQQPHPPIMIGGGSKRVLSVAAREADIVGFTNRALPDGSKDSADITAEATARKVAWVREAAGERFDGLELSVMATTVVATSDRVAAATRLAATMGLTADEVLASPQVLVGTVDEMVAHLEDVRTRLGISYVVVLESDVETLAPVVARLAGR
jgi:probable F420-dependent oxidoreductase